MVDPKSFSELIYPTSSIDNLLLSCIERMACWANLDSQILAKCRFCYKRITTRAGNLNFWILRMYVFFHVILICCITLSIWKSYAINRLGFARITIASLFFKHIWKAKTKLIAIYLSTKSVDKIVDKYWKINRS